jgi:hypothetical protein
MTNNQLPQDLWFVVQQYLQVFLCSVPQEVFKSDSIGFFSVF